MASDLYLDPDDDLSRVITLTQAAQVASVSRRTVTRWVATGRLPLLPGGKHTTERAVLDCERDRHVASRRGRPGPRTKFGGSA